jgi:hypothetical protein
MKKVARALMLGGVLSLTLMAGQCSTTGGRSGAFCDVERPISLSAATIATMKHDELAAAVAHNRQGEHDCGWRPPNR